MEIATFLLSTEKDEEVISSSLWILSVIAEDDEKLLNDKATIETAVSYIESAKTDLKIPAIRIIGSICTGDDDSVNKVITAGALSSLATCLKLEKECSILIELCWAISNISLGPAENVEQLLDLKVIHRLIEIIHSYTDFRVNLEER
eukprot:TRINITY_DN26124_c0_g1_i1.p2 TRINITY_DN26124_c0_g1~~TRINITY_DN26124_c0_g1_i1.p2  ORF type:complete len:147 (+),score=15.28 TRINITY_DN26124_c0_g1_i1:166-606(+)